MAPPYRLRVGVLASGQGTTLQALLDAASAPGAPFEVVAVASDRVSAPALERARRAGVPVSIHGPQDRSAPPWQGAMADFLRGQRVELVVLAGYLRTLGPEFLRAWEGRTLNTHPSLLPAFGGPGMFGLKVHAAVLASGARETGVTVHVVTADLDAGPVIAQVHVPVPPGADAQGLADHLRPVEQALLVRVVEGIARGSPALPFGHLPR